MYFARQQQDNLMFNAAGIIFLVNLYWFIDLVSNIVVLTNRRRLAISAQAQEPDPQIVGIQPIDWWSLLKAGFEPVIYERPFRHPEVPLEGCPWRVLERGSIRIPVIRSGGEKLGERKGELYDKHQIRLVAYALLLEAADHIEVPFGLVVAADSPKGLAMSITPALRERAIRFLNDFVNNLQNSQQQGLEPRPPHNHNRCAHCKYGAPVEISAREINAQRKRGKSLLVLQNGNGKTYHCQCGDRFRTAPPHAKSIKLGLAASLDYS